MDILYKYSKINFNINNIILLLDNNYYYAFVKEILLSNDLTFDDVEILLNYVYINKTSNYLYKLFPKLINFVNNRSKSMINDKCPICYEVKDLILYDCVVHHYCIQCYDKQNLCALCKVPKNDYYHDLFEIFE
jgi:hypothetical protein